MVICFWSKLVLQGNTQETRLYLVIRNEIRIHNCDNWQWFLNYRSDVESSYLQQSLLMKSNNKVVSTCRICVGINYWLLFYWRRPNYFRYSRVKQNRILVPRKISAKPNINGCLLPKGWKPPSEEATTFDLQELTTHLIDSQHLLWWQNYKKQNVLGNILLVVIVTRLTL